MSLPARNKNKNVDVYFDPDNIGGLKSEDEETIILSGRRKCVILNNC